MAHYTGSALYITFGAGTTVLSGDQRTLDVENTMDTVDTTAGADTDKSSLPTLRDATFKVTLLDNGTAGSAVRAACAVSGTQGTFTFGPEGNSSGKPKYSCLAYVTGYNTSYPYDGEVEIEVTFQKTGSWITNYELSGSTF